MKKLALPHAPPSARQLIELPLLLPELWLPDDFDEEELLELLGLFELLESRLEPDMPLFDDEPLDPDIPLPDDDELDDPGLLPLDDDDEPLDPVEPERDEPAP